MNSLPPTKAKLFNGKAGSLTCCNNCPSKGCKECPMYGVGLNPIYLERQAAREAKREASGEASGEVRWDGGEARVRIAAAFTALLGGRVRLRIRLLRHDLLVLDSRRCQRGRLLKPRRVRRIWLLCRRLGLLRRTVRSRDILIRSLDFDSLVVGLIGVHLSRSAPLPSGFVRIAEAEVVIPLWALATPERVVQAGVR